MSQSKVQHIFRVFDALNLVKGIKAVGGPDHQTYYIESDVYAPDRRITPLILQPYVEVSDPNGVIPAGDKVGELSSASWYIGEAILANKITAKESEATLDTPFAIGENNALHVRKNSTKSILLIFEGEYLDIRKDKNIHISLTYTLTTTSNTEVKPAPKLMLSKPQSWKYCPLEDQTKAVIEATVSQDSKLYQSAVQWVKVEDDKETLIGEDDSFYLEGQNTDKLTINPSLMGSTLIRAKNHDEVFYNQVYGINPEWDGRIHEVMENRNFIVHKEIVSGYLTDEGGILNDTSHATTGFILLQKGSYIFTVYGVGVRQTRVGVYSTEKVYKSTKLYSGWISSISLNITEDSYIRISSSLSTNQSEGTSTNKWKLEQGDTATPYTPAPEDLNYINYISNTFTKFFDLSKIVPWDKADYTYDNDTKELEMKAGSANSARIAAGFYLNNDKPINVDLYLNFEYNINKEPIFNYVAMTIRQGDADGQYSATHEKYTADGQWHAMSSKMTIKDDRYKLLYMGFQSDINNTILKIRNVNISTEPIISSFPSPEDYAPDGIIKGTYQSDMKFTRYFPKLETEIDFLTGDTLRAGMDTVKMKAVFKTNKEEIKNPEQYFDIKWYLDPVEAGGKAEYLGQGESLEVPISQIPPKARAIPFRLEYEFK